MLIRNNGNGINGRLSAASPPSIHGHLHHQTTADESSLQSNSNSEDFSDEGIDPSKGLVSSVASQPSCQSKSYHDDTNTKNPQRIVLTPSANPTPSSAIRNRFKVIPRSGTTDEEDPYGPMAGNFYPTASRSQRSATSGEFWKSTISGPDPTKVKFYNHISHVTFLSSVIGQIPAYSRILHWKFFIGSGLVRIEKLKTNNY